VSKRTPLRLDALREEAPAPFPAPQPSAPLAPPAASGPEPTTTVYARVPWALGEELRDLARRRSREEGRRVTVNDLVVEALRRLLN
jgi:hypothetical protein